MNILNIIRVLIGAPKYSSSIYKDANDTGTVFSCSVETTGQKPIPKCSEVNLFRGKNIIRN